MSSQLQHFRVLFLLLFSCTLLELKGEESAQSNGALLSALPVVDRLIEQEDWPELLDVLRGEPLTNNTLRLVVVRALYETGRLPDEQFSWLHRPGPELLSTSELQAYAGAAHLAETLLQLGYLNAAERLAFDSLEMEGENPPALRTLARLHLVKGQTRAAAIFLNRLSAYPDHREWTGNFRCGLNSPDPASADRTISRIRTNLLTGDGIAAGLTTERVLRLALSANPNNPMAFQFLMAHQLQERRLLFAVQTLAKSPLAKEGVLPRHYAEAVLLHRSFYPGINLSTLLPRVPPAVAANFDGFRNLMGRAAGRLEQVRNDAWRDFGDTYWFYYLFGSAESSQENAPPGAAEAHE